LAARLAVFGREPAGPHAIGRSWQPEPEHDSPSPSTSRSSTTANRCTPPSATAPRSRHSPTASKQQPPPDQQPDELSKILDTAQTPCPPAEGAGGGCPCSRTAHVAARRFTARLQPARPGCLLFAARRSPMRSSSE
jgi:hypothetical protein